MTAKSKYRRLRLRHLVIGWLKNLAPDFQPIRSKTNPTLNTWFFPRFEKVTGICHCSWLLLFLSSIYAVPITSSHTAFYLASLCITSCPRYNLTFLARPHEKERNTTCSRCSSSFFSFSSLSWKQKTDIKSYRLENVSKQIKAKYVAMKKLHSQRRQLLRTDSETRWPWSALLIPD